jgi:hypothetical protein
MEIDKEDELQAVETLPVMIANRALESKATVHTLESLIEKQTKPDNDDVFYLFLQKQKRGAELHIPLEEGTYHKRLSRGPNTNDMKK